MQEAIFDSPYCTTKRSRDLVVNFILFDLILMHTIADPSKINTLTIVLLFQSFTFQNIHSYAVANDKILQSVI